jgi:NAD(P)-dependent dehydrogenase (short-subunit alcohol dehydrogenase family)
VDFINAKKRVEEVRGEGGEAIAYECSVLDEQQLEKTAGRIAEDLGEVDFLINGAGGNNTAGSTTREYFDPDDLGNHDINTFFDLTREGFAKTFDLNFLGTFLPTKVFARPMALRKSGNIINISSMSAFTPLTKVGAYSAAKAAVSNFTRWCAVHFAGSGIRVNALAPGFFMTEQLRFLHINQETGELTPRAKQVVAHTPMKRYGEPQELVGTVVYLLSEASDFVTGTVIPIDGGFSSFAI